MKERRNPFSFSVWKGRKCMSLDLNYKPEELVDTEPLSREDWLNYRRLGLGGSDAAAILGISPFCTKRDLYYDKIGVQVLVNEEEENWVAKEVGHRLEDLVAKIFSEKTGLKVYPIRKMFRHPLYPFMLADVDFFIEYPDGSTGILECKTTNYNCQGKWANDATPVNYEYQVRHYFAVTNVNKGYIACLYGNNENEFFIRPIERDLDIEEDLIAEEKEFWEEYVEKRVEPEYTEKPDLVLESIRKHCGPADTGAEQIVLNGKYLSNLEQYLQLKEEKAKHDSESKRLETRMKESYLQVVEELGANCNAVLRVGNTAYEVAYTPSYRTGIDKKGLEKMKAQLPDVYEDYVRTSESRRFSVKKKVA